LAQRSRSLMTNIPTFRPSEPAMASGQRVLCRPTCLKTSGLMKPSLVYTTVPFEQEVHIVGWPQVILHVSSSARVAAFVAKLADVAPNGHSALIIDGSLNGTRRISLTDPAPMKSGEIYQLNIPMPPTGWVIKPGHRLRLAVSSSDFPNLWPTAENATNRIYRGSAHPSCVILPVVPESSLPPPQFLPAPSLHDAVRTL